MNFEDRLFGGEIPVFLAPMSGVTDAPFRRIVHKLGVTATVSEMISSEALVRNNKKTYKRLQNESKIKIVQIMGSDPQKMSESARINADYGADIIDINMGCPVKKIVNNDSGAALLKNEKLAVSIAESVVKSVDIPVTLKMRLGWDDDRKNYSVLAKHFEEVGIKMLTIHCRTRSQMYRGTADWKAIANLKEIIHIPYLCNGDIRTGEDALQALTESKADGVMIGRGALGRPWTLNMISQFLNESKEVPPPSLTEQYRIVMEHFHDTLKFYGKTFGVKIFRKHFCWYSAGLSNAASFRENINRLDDIGSIELLVSDFYEICFRENSCKLLP